MYTPKERKEARRQASTKYSNSAKGKARKVEFYKRNPKIEAQYARKYRYGLSEEEFSKLLSSQNNACALCFRKFSSSLVPCVDHSHTTGKVRAVLCRYCNTKLAVLEDELWVLRAKVYLSK